MSLATVKLLHRLYPCPTAVHKGSTYNAKIRRWQHRDPPTSMAWIWSNSAADSLRFCLARRARVMPRLSCVRSPVPPRSSSSSWRPILRSQDRQRQSQHESSTLHADSSHPDHVHFILMPILRSLDRQCLIRTYKHACAAQRICKPIFPHANA